jgi:hypothetical protein
MPARYAAAPAAVAASVPFATLKDTFSTSRTRALAISTPSVVQITARGSGMVATATRIAPEVEVTAR